MALFQIGHMGGPKIRILKRVHHQVKLSIAFRTAQLRKIILIRIFRIPFKQYLLDKANDIALAER